MFLLAWKNLIKEQTRLILTLVGITFAVVLIFFDTGVYLGFLRSSSILIDRSKADIWITMRNHVNFESARPFPERKLWKVKQVKGVEWVEPVAKGGGLMKLPNGAAEWIMIFGFRPEVDLGWPWQMREGMREDLKLDNTIIVDESSVSKLGKLKVGDKVEIFDTRVKVVGISQGVKTSTTFPVVFSNYQTAKKLSSIYRAMEGDQVTFLLAKVAADMPVGEVIERLRKIEGIDVYSREGLSWQTKKYWIVWTGVGIGFSLMALLGFLVGVVIVGQTIYASTMEHLREYGTLKALGATNRDLLAVIIYQAFANTLMGYLLALGTAYLMQQGYDRLGLSLIITFEMQVVMFVVTLIMCLGASVLSIRQVFRIDPVIVFRA